MSSTESNAEIKLPEAGPGPSLAAPEASVSTPVGASCGYRRYLGRFFASALGVVVAVMGLNAIADPAHLFTEGSYEQGIARIQIAGHHVINVSQNYNDRLLQRYVIRGLARLPEAIVLGSSRTMQVRASDFPGRTFYNHSVGAFTLEDAMAIYEQYLERDFRPAEILLAVDPWLFNVSHGFSHWHCHAAKAAAMARRLALAPNAIMRMETCRYSDLLSLTYLGSSLEILRSGRGQAVDYIERSVIPPDGMIEPINGYVEFADGSMGYGKSYREADAAWVHTQAIETARDEHVVGLANFQRFEPALVDGLERFVHRLVTDGARVTLVLTPYHPVSYKLYTTDPRYRLLHEAELYYREMARRLGLPIIGSYDPSVGGFGESDFMDGMHAKRRCIAQIMAQYGKTRKP